jgi:hypothetical protein
MRQALSASAIALALTVLPPLVAIPESIAQAPAPAPAPGQEMRTSKINLTVEQRHVIKEIVKDMPVQKAPDDAKVTTGSAAPEGAVLRSFPSEITDKVPQIKSHKFFVKGNQIVLVGPDGNDVVEIIE